MTKIPDWYYVSIINSDFISLYVDNFINNTSHFQINDARQLPIIIPTSEQLDAFKSLFDRAVIIKKDFFSNKISFEESEILLNKIQKELDDNVQILYQI